MGHPTMQENDTAKLTPTATPLQSSMATTKKNIFAFIII